MSVIALRGGGCALVLDAHGPGVSRVVRWGAGVEDGEALAVARPTPGRARALDLQVACATPKGDSPL